MIFYFMLFLGVRKGSSLYLYSFDLLQENFISYLKMVVSRKVSKPTPELLLPSDGVFMVCNYYFYLLDISILIKFRISFYNLYEMFTVSGTGLTDSCYLISTLYCDNSITLYCDTHYCRSAIFWSVSLCFSLRASRRFKSFV